MKALLINGSPHEKGCTYTALQELAATLEKNAVESEILYLGTKPIQQCIACRACAKLGKCVFNDQVNEVAARLDEFDAIVLGSPVYYSAPAGGLVAFCDRLFYSAGKKMAGKLGASVVSCRRGGATGAFEQLNQFFTMLNMPVVSSQYWNQVHGNKPEDVAQDLEGLQTMRTLGQNMAWLLKCIAAGKAAGIEKPVYEEKIATNFIE